MISFNDFKKQFDETLSQKTSEQIISELEDLGYEFVALIDETTFIDETIIEYSENKYTMDENNNYLLAA